MLVALVAVDYGECIATRSSGGNRHHLLKVKYSHVQMDER